MKLSLKTLFVLPLLIIAFSGCEKDNPVEGDHDHEHAEAAGMVIAQNNVEIVRYEAGEVSGQMTIKTGETTSILSVQFIDEHDGDLFTPEEDHYVLAWTFADDNIAAIIQDESTDKWEFKVQGIIAGETTVEMKIMHDDHADFVSLPVPVIVTP